MGYSAGLSPKLTTKYIQDMSSSVTGGGGGVKSTAAQGLKNATPSSAITPSTISSRGNNQHFACLYGVGAQRTKVGSGMHLNAKSWNSNENFMTLQSMNRGVHFSTDFGMPNIGHVHHCDHAKKPSTLETITALLATLGTIGLGVAGAVKNNSNVEKTSVGGKSLANSEIPTNNTKDTSTPASLTAMKGAKDSSTLRDNIGIAKTDKSRMEGELKNLEANLPSMKEASETATKQLEELKPKVVEAKEARDTAETNKKDAEGVKNANEKALNSAQERLSGAKDGLVAAKDGLISAKSSLGSAKATLAATPETKTQVNADGTTTQVPNPDYQKAQQAVKDAENAVKEAQDKFDEANKNYDAATDAEKKAQSDFQKATEQLAKSEEHLGEMTEKFNKLEAEYKNLESQQSEAQKKVDDYNNALTRQTELKSHIAQLESEIPAQEKRLTELVQKEEKGYDAATNIINQMENKLKGKDGIEGTDDDKKKLSKKDQEKYDNAKNLQRNVNYTKLLKTAGEKHGSLTFRTGSYNGETLYMIGTKPVDQKTYEFKLKIQHDTENLTKVADPFS